MELWSSSKIKIMRAGNNRFRGQVPEFVSLASSLEQVEIDNNSFSGEIPHGLGVIKNLYKFSTSENGFEGGLPPNLCDSPVVIIVNISHNNLSGKIPKLKNCKKLVSLSLARNAFNVGISIFFTVFLFRIVFQSQQKQKKVKYLEDNWSCIRVISFSYSFLEIHPECDK
ncbi:unnamed protein product [Eruca vesicaria subsp. sativa]|uniref:Uncharacterized protein n=1 Tax=Eruca vesicaria subsp. sativa TaxID=29727 RepID=A0ABC8M9F8_ERUVS|nr:unnamed protein product [Eruca vesicaria subsp. sativa]